MGKRARHPPLKAKMAQETKSLQEARRLGLKSVVGVKIGTSSSAIEEKINEIVESLTSNLEESLNGTIQVGPSKALSINAVILKANKKEAQQQWLGMVLDTGSQRSDPLSTGKKSWVNIIEKEMSKKKGSVQDNFDIEKVVNEGFKLDYVAPTMQGGSIINEIELDDISSKGEYWKNSIVCYVLGLIPHML